MRAGGSGQRNARGRSTARAIERAAVLLAQERGPDGFTVQDVCAATGVTERTFFNHFAAKEDALLGWDTPRLSDAAVERYLAEPHVGLLTGALTLVELPAELTDDPGLAAARLAVLSRAPTLARRQAERLTPLVGQVAEVVARKLRSTLDEPVDEPELMAAAHAIARMGAGLLLDQPALRGGPDDDAEVAPAPFALLARLADRLF